MRRQAFLLGLFATGSQTLILRELVSTLNGSELFIGTALFGWLIWVALGAYVGGKLRRPPASTSIFLCGAIALPVILVLCRLSPSMVTDTIGELIPFSAASLLSIIMALPQGLLSGLLFPVIARQGESDERTILRVYLIEGLGACAAGVGVTLVAGYWISSLATAILLSVTVAVGAAAKIRGGRLAVVLLASLLAVVLVMSGAVGRIERAVEQIRYPGYEVVNSFDTPYTHQAILRRNSETVLMTDNSVEAADPDIETNENLVLPARVYLNTSVRALVPGRAEFGLARLSDSVEGIEIRCIDPRRELESAVDSIETDFSHVERIDQDLIQYLSPDVVCRLPFRSNAVIVPLGDLSSFRVSRLICRETLERFRQVVGDGGLLVILTRFDTDRYLTPAVGDILGTLWRELTSQFSHVSVWPGTNTLLLASNTNFFHLSNDTLFARLARLNYRPQFVHEMYLHDRLSDFKVAGLIKELDRCSGSHTVDRPTLVMKQALYRAKANAMDRLAASIVFTHNSWLFLFPAGMIALLGVSLVTPGRRRRFGLPLYVIAGFISFVVELLIFYLYQSRVGSLHAELAALIGVFMFGLSCGTYLGTRQSTAVVERGSLILIAMATAALLCWNSVWPIFFAPYSFVLIFVTALATGGLFVAATRRYYAGRAETNRGIGYAVEISGSAVGALLTTTVLLPTIGLSWILISCLILIGLAGLGSLIAPPAS